MTTIEFEQLYKSITEQFAGNQKRIDVNSAIGAYYGMSPDGYLRLAFRSSVNPPKIESTKLLRVTQGEEAPAVFWSCFDLLSHDAHAAFFAFCQNLVEAVSETDDEIVALSKLKKRYISWKALFRNTAKKTLTKDVIQGLFGELYFLNDFMIGKYGVAEAIKSWGGPDMTSKDFAINTEWFEVKTIGVTTPCVTISSVAQLSSSYPGKLAVVRVEQMADEFTNGCSSISELITAILGKINDETVEGIFVNKVSSYGVPVLDEAFAMKFDVKSFSQYQVTDDFPRITIEKVPFPEISNVSYEISVSAIARFLEE